MIRHLLFEDIYPPINPCAQGQVIDAPPIHRDCKFVSLSVSDYIYLYAFNILGHQEYAHIIVQIGMEIQKNFDVACFIFILS